MEQNYMDLIEKIILVLLGLGGKILYDRVKQRKKMKVELKWDIPHHANLNKQVLTVEDQEFQNRIKTWPPSRIAGTRLFLEAVNLGNTSIVVASCYLIKPSDKWTLQSYMLESDPSLPCELTNSRNVKCRFPAKDVAETLFERHRGAIDLVGTVEDTTGKKFKSKKVSFDIDFWLKNG